MARLRTVTETELAARLPHVLRRVEAGRRTVVTRDGEAVAVLMPPDHVPWVAALAKRFRERLPPFSQAAIDEWLAGELAPGVAEVLGVAFDQPPGNSGDT